MAGQSRDLTISGHEVVLELDDEVISQGDVISGAVVVIPTGEREVGKVSIRLREHWRQVEPDERVDGLTTRARSRVHAKAKLKKFESSTIVRKRDFSVQLMQAQRCRFEFQLPRNARVSTDAAGWMLEVSLKGSPSVHPDVDLMKLDVRVAEEVQAVLDAWVERLKFTEDRARRRWEHQGLTTKVSLMPPKALAGEFDGVDLELRQGEGGAVEGRVIFDLEEKSVADYLRAAVGSDRISREIALSHEQVFVDGAVDLDGIAQVFRTLLAGVLAER